MDVQYVANQTKDYLKKGQSKEAISFLKDQVYYFYNDTLNEDAKTLEQRWNQQTDHSIRATQDQETQYRESNLLAQSILQFLHKVLDYQKDLSINASGEATARLRDIIQRLEANPLLMTDNALFIEDLKKVFIELDNTYSAIQQAIRDYQAPGLQVDGPSIDPYLEFENGRLKDQIENGRGRCHLIAQYYQQPNGIREQITQKAVAQQIPTEMVQDADQQFTHLMEADLDVFMQMAQIGEYLQAGATIISDLLFDGKKDEARIKIKADREQLKPLIQELQHGHTELKEVKRKLGLH